MLLQWLLFCLFAGESDITEKPIDPIKVYSDKELVREFEKIASTLVPEKDWSIRIAAIQRLEGLVSGGFYPLSHQPSHQSCCGTCVYAVKEL